MNALVALTSASSTVFPTASPTADLLSMVMSLLLVLVVIIALAFFGKKIKPKPCQQ